MPEIEKEPTKQVHKKRINNAALWATALGSLMTTAVPKIIDAFSSKPSVAQVQTMIADQADKLTKTLNSLIDSARALNANQEAHNTRISKLEGDTQLLHDIVLPCCIKQSTVNQAKPPALTPVVVEPPAPMPEPPAMMQKPVDVPKKVKNLDMGEKL